MMNRQNYKNIEWKGITMHRAIGRILWDDYKKGLSSNFEKLDKNDILLENYKLLENLQENVHYCIVYWKREMLKYSHTHSSMQ